MKALILISIFLNLVAAVFDKSLVLKWAEYKTEFGKTYNNARSELKAFNIWKTNLKRIEIHNEQEEKGYQLFRIKMNYFGDIKEIPLQKKLIFYGTTKKNIVTTQMILTTSVGIRTTNRLKPKPKIPTYKPTIKTVQTDPTTTMKVQTDPTTTLKVQTDPTTTLKVRSNSTET